MEQIGGPKDNIFSGKRWINCRGKLVDISRPLVMGILNVTPDSFFDGGKYEQEEQLLSRVGKMLEEGADMIDVGGYSSRPGAGEVAPGEELARVLPAVKTIRRHFPGCILSVDTFRADIARQAIEAGADIVNDISAGEFDSEMFRTVAELQVPYVLMHMQGTPQNMQIDPYYEDVTAELLSFFSGKIRQLRLMGVNDLIIDPGFGFGKSVEDNYVLLRTLRQFRLFGLPVLAGVSRKSMINKVLGRRPENALNGTTVVNTIALCKGALILRVHDVEAAKEAVKIVNYLQKA